MTLDEFEAEVRATIEEFCSNWRERAETDPDGWPLEMNAGDWWEHFDWWAIWKTPIKPNTGE